MKKGDKFLVTGGKYQGMILTVRTSLSVTHRSIGNNGFDVYPMEDLENGAAIAFEPDEYREWTKKDERIKSKFHKLFQMISDNKTTLVARAAKDNYDKFARSLIEKHQDHMILVKEKYNLFLYEKRFDEKVIKELNDIWRKEKECIDFYANPNWIYEKSLSLTSTPKYSEKELTLHWRILAGMDITDDNKAHAVMYNGV